MSNLTQTQKDRIEGSVPAAYQPGATRVLSTMMSMRTGIFPTAPHLSEAHKHLAAAGIIEFTNNRREVIIILR